MNDIPEIVEKDVERVVGQHLIYFEQHRKELNLAKEKYKELKESFAEATKIMEKIAMAYDSFVPNKGFLEKVREIADESPIEVAKRRVEEKNFIDRVNAYDENIPF